MGNYTASIIALIAIVTALAYFYGRRVARKRLAVFTGNGTGKRFHSQPNYHGLFLGGSAAFTALVIFAAGMFVNAQPGDGAAIPPHLVAMAIALSAVAVTLMNTRLIRSDFRARRYVEFFINSALLLCSVIAVLTTLGIVLSLLFESLRFFEQVSIFEFLTGLQWSPQTALREDQAGQSGSFGAIPIFAGTFLVMAVAIFVAAPIGLMIAIYLSEYATKRTRGIVKPAIEILAGVPTVVYGFFALLTVGPTVRAFAESLGFAVPTQSAIAAGSVMGIMIIPFISSLSDDVINAVPQTLRDGSYALGATKSETMTKVVFAGALPGIIGALLLAVSRAIGETMIVVMAAGRAANLTGNPFEAVTTVTVQIVALLTGDQEFDSPKTLAAFALGLVLFVITLVLNVIALLVVRKYRERYE